MALVLKSGAKRTSSLGALFVSNPKKRNPIKRKATKRKAVKRTNAKRKTTKRKVARKPAAKRIVLKLNPLRLKRRKNALAIKRNPKHKNPLMKRRKNALAIKRNPKHKNPLMKRRKNAKRTVRRIMRNPKAMGLKLLKPVEKLVGKVPVLKQITPYLAPSVFGMAVVVPFNWAYGKVSDYLQKTTWMPSYLKTVDKYAGLALTGMGVAALSYYGLTKTKLVSKQTAKSGAIAFAIVSGAAQFMRLKELYDAGELYGSKKEEATAGLAYMGDGMAYDVVPMSSLAYSDASAIDAQQTPYDLDATEKAMGQRGADAWMRAFGECAYRASSQDGSSRYAGKHGHRWGWLIKVLGWDRFAKLCKMSAPDRIRVISQIKIACINSAQQTFDSAPSMSGLAMDMGGLAYSSSYSGLAMVGSAH